MYEIQIHDAETKAFAALSALKDKFLTIFLQNCTRRQLKLFKRKAFIKLLKNREIMICKEFCIETQTKNEAILYFKKMHEQEMTEAERSALQTFSRLKRQYQDRLLKNVVNRWREDYKRCAFLQWNSVIFQMQQKMHNIRHEKQSFALLEAKKNYQVRIKNAEESFAKRFSALGRKHQHVMLLRVTNLWLHFKKLGSFTVWKSAYAHAIALEKRFSSKSDVDQLNSMVALQKSYETKLMQAERNSSTFIQAIAVKLDDVTVQLREKKRELDEVKDYYDREILQAECSYSSALYGWKYKYKSLILKNVVHKWVKSFKTLVMKRLWMYSHASREQEKFDLKKREELKEVENVSASLFLKLESLQTKFSKNRKLKEHAQIDETNVLVEQKRASVNAVLEKKLSELEKMQLNLSVSREEVLRDIEISNKAISEKDATIESLQAQIKSMSDDNHFLSQSALASEAKDRTIERLQKNLETSQRGNEAMAKNLSTVTELENIVAILERELERSDVEKHNLTLALDYAQSRVNGITLTPTSAVNTVRRRSAVPKRSTGPPSIDAVSQSKKTGNTWKWDSAIQMKKDISKYVNDEGRLAGERNVTEQAFKNYDSLTLGELDTNTNANTHSDYIDRGGEGTDPNVEDPGDSESVSSYIDGDPEVARIASIVGFAKSFLNQRRLDKERALLSSEKKIRRGRGR